MHAQFPEWFRSANLPLPDEVLENRWIGVEAFEFDRNAIVSLVEVFFSNFDNKEAFLASFRKAFQDADSSFRMRENNLELSILAGTELVDIMDRADKDYADLAALALVSCAAQNLRRTPCVAEIPEYAVRYLAKRTVQRNQLTTQEKEGLETAALETKQLRRDLDILGEETNALWWLLGETSRDTNLRWNKHGVNQTAILAGKELADLTRLAPGPAGSAAFLDRVIKCAKAKPPAETTVAEAIVDIPLEIRENFLKSNYVPELAMVTPIFHGIKLSVDLAENDSWAKSLEKSGRIKSSGRISPHMLSYQVFLESMTARVWKEV